MLHKIHKRKKQQQPPNVTLHLHLRYRYSYHRFERRKYLFERQSILPISSFKTGRSKYHSFFFSYFLHFLKTFPPILFMLFHTCSYFFSYFFTPTFPYFSLLFSSFSILFFHTLLYFFVVLFIPSMALLYILHDWHAMTGEPFYFVNYWR